MLKMKAQEGTPNTNLSQLRDRLWRAALALTRSHSEAEDLTQQTIAVVLARRPECIGHVGYLRKTMCHLWLDEHRSMRRRLRRLARVAFSLRATKPDPDKVTDEELLHRVHTAIDALPPRQRAAIVLRLVEGLNYTEIATTMGCPVGTVRANIHLARRSVRQAIGEPCDDQID